MEIPSVLVYTITYSGKDYVWDKFSEAAKAMSYPNYHHVIVDNTDDNGEYAEKLRKDGFDVVRTPRGNNSREAMTRGQEWSRLKAIDENYDYIMSLESDIIVTPTIIQDLIGDAKEYVGALYFIGDEHTRIPCITIPKKHETYGLMGTRLLEPHETKLFYKKGLINVNNCGLGCTLMERQVFTVVAYSYFPDLRTHSDSFYANEVWHKGFRVFVDTDIVLEHYNVPWDTVDDR